MTMEEIREIQQVGIRLKKEKEQRKLEEMKRLGITPQPPQKPTFHNLYGFNPDEATLLYIFVMIGGSIFHDRIGIWILATFLWLRHIMSFKK